MLTALDLPTIWFVLVGALLSGYAILDGFDLGVGALHVLARGDDERRVFLNAIGPVWDGNEVWLVTGGGALFAAFPVVYANVFSGFYLWIMLLLVTFIFRAVAIEFRSKLPGRTWRACWDVSFHLGSVGVALITGVVLGNLARGLPLDAQHRYSGDFLDLLNPYAMLVGVTTLALFIMHGAIYLVMKTEGELQARVRGWVRPALIGFVLCYVYTTMATLLYVPTMTEAFKRSPALLLVPALNVLAIANIPRELHLGRDLRAFLSSCAAIAALLLLFGLGMYPHLVVAVPEHAHSLTIANASSSPGSLANMLIIAALGAPLVVAYTVAIYWVFRGKVKVGPASY